MADGHDRLVINRQVLLWDGWSGALVVEGLLGLYAADGEDAAPAAAGSFRDYLLWLREWDTAAAVQAWRSALAGLDGPTLVVPAARGLPPVAPARITVELPEATASALRAASRAHGVTLNTIFNAALALVLAATTGSDDVVFGTTVAGRPTELDGMDEVIGLFLNTVSVRVRLDPRETVGELLRRVAADRLDLLDHEYLGLGEIQRAPGAVRHALRPAELHRRGGERPDQRPPWDHRRQQPRPHPLSADVRAVPRCADHRPPGAPPGRRRAGLGRGAVRPAPGHGRLAGRPPRRAGGLP
nr:condensation domain-containing protein [Candidatus Frankia alpina]